MDALSNLKQLPYYLVSNHGNAAVVTNRLNSTAVSELFVSLIKYDR